MPTVSFNSRMAIWYIPAVLFIKVVKKIHIGYPHDSIVPNVIFIFIKTRQWINEKSSITIFASPIKSWINPTAEELLRYISLTWPVELSM